jgi:hypothetical protein
MLNDYVKPHCGAKRLPVPTRGRDPKVGPNAPLGATILDNSVPLAVRASALAGY